MGASQTLSINLYSDRTCIQNASEQGTLEPAH